MWLAYRTYPEIVDLKSAVTNISAKFEDLRWHVEHEEIYGNQGGNSAEDVEQCQKLAAYYSKGAEICDLYLNHNYDIEWFLYEMTAHGFERYLYEVKKFIPEHLKILLPNSDSETESDQHTDTD